MKKILSLILAISLVLALLPTFASAAVTTDPAGTLEFLPGETSSANTFTATYKNANRSTSAPTLSEGNTSITLSTGSQWISNAANKTGPWPSYVAMRLTVNKPGTYAIAFKNALTGDKKSAGAAPGIYFKKADETYPVNSLSSITNVDRSTFAGTAQPLAYHNFSTAATGEYGKLKNDNGKDVVLKVEEAGDYFVILSFIPESATRSTKFLVNGTLTEYVSGLANGWQYIDLAGIKLIPVTEMYFDNEAIISTKYINETNKQVEGDVTKWTVSGASGWAVDADLSRIANFQAQVPSKDMFRINLAGTSSVRKPWYNYGSGSKNNSINGRKSVFTADTTFPLEQGAYKVKFTGGKYNKGGKVFIYVDEKFAGVYDSFDEAATSAVLAPEVNLNTLKLTPDANGSVSVSFKLAEPEENERTTSILSKLTFEKVETAPTPEKIVIEEAPEALEEGVSAPISAYVKMSDGSKRFLNGSKRYDGTSADFTHIAVKDNDNYIDISVSDNLVFTPDYASGNEATAIGVFTNASGNATGTVTANGNGEATITVTAKVDGVELTPATATIALPEPSAPAEPGEELTETVTFGFGAELPHLNGYISAPGYTANFPAQVPVGTKITLSAEKEKDEYRFLYWKISGRFYSADNEITLNVARNTSVLAVYADVEYLETEKYKKIYFWNADKSYYSQISTPEEKLPYIPGGLEMTGMSFVGWYLDEETELTTDTLITELVTHAVAKYEPLDTEYTVKVNGEENKGKYNSPVSVSAPETFTYWKLGEEKLSFRRAFEFFNYGNAEITSVFDESVKAIPTVVIEKSLGAAFITYDTPAGYERIEAGIIFGPTAEIKVNSANSKANAQKTAAFGQFTAKPYDNEQYARGYQIFKKDGIVRVIYTNAIEMN